MTIVLTLPYPVSANRYWRAVTINGHAMMVPTKEAKAWKKEVALRALVAGIRKPLAGRIEVAYRLYPARPQDWQARARKDPLWADGVRCIDLGNANKVLEDALNGTVIEDDRWTWRLIGEKMEPDEHGARLVVWVRPIGPPPAAGRRARTAAPDRNHAGRQDGDRAARPGRTGVLT